MTGSALLLASALLALPARDGGLAAPPQGDPPGDAPRASDAPLPGGPPASSEVAAEGAAHHHGLRELLDVLEVMDTPVHSRNQLQLEHDLEDHDVGWLLEITAGRFLAEKKTALLAVEYETPLDPVAARGEVMMVGAMPSCFYSW